MAAPPADDTREELRSITAALRAHAEWVAATGATGLPRAAPDLARSRAASPPRADSVEPSEPPMSPGRASDATIDAAQQPERRPRPEVTEPLRERESLPASDAPPTPIEDAETLEQLRDQVAVCTRCRLHASRTQAVFARGTAVSRLCFVGEGPGADEDEQGYPFVGAAGQLLDRMIAAMGLGRDEVYVCNIVKCRPPKNRKPEPDEMAACRPFLERQLRLAAPEVIVALGATAVQGLLDTNEGITRLRGRWKLYRGEVAVMPTFHPAYLLRSPRAKRAVWEDLQAVLRQLGRPLPAKR